VLVVVLRPRRIRCLRSNELTAQSSCGKVRLRLLSQHKRPVFRGRPRGRARERFPNFGFWLKRRSWNGETFIQSAWVLPTLTRVPNPENCTLPSLTRQWVSFMLTQQKLDFIQLRLMSWVNRWYSAGSPRMSKQRLLQRLVASLATNHGVQPKQTEIWQRLKSLTPREVDVLCYVLGGQLNKQIAAELGIGEKTIKVHRGHVMEKLGVQSSGQLLAMVLRVVLTD